MKELMPLSEFTAEQLFNQDGILNAKYLQGSPRPYRFNASTGVLNLLGTQVLTKPNESFSANVVFNTPTAGEITKQRAELEQAALANLQKVIELQKRNLADTVHFQEALKATSEAQWNGVAERQKEVRSIMRDLLSNPVKPLGSLTASGQKLYVNEMVLAVDSLQSIPSAADTRKGTLAAAFHPQNFKLNPFDVRRADTRVELFLGIGQNRAPANRHSRRSVGVPAAFDRRSFG